MAAANSVSLTAQEDDVARVITLARLREQMSVSPSVHPDKELLEPLKTWAAELGAEFSMQHWHGSRMSGLMLSAVRHVRSCMVAQLQHLSQPSRAQWAMNVPALKGSVGSECRAAPKPLWLPHQP